MRRLAVVAGAALFLALIAAARALPRSWASRVAVAGHSMEPTLAPGDWLLVDPLAYSGRMPRMGELVVVLDPRSIDRLLVKRVARVDSEGVLTLAGDHPAHATEEGLAAVDPDSVIGRPWMRYWPFERLGPVH